MAALDNAGCAFLKVHVDILARCGREELPLPQSDVIFFFTSPREVQKNCKEQKAVMSQDKSAGVCESLHSLTKRM